MIISATETHSQYERPRRQTHHCQMLDFYSFTLGKVFKNVFAAKHISCCCGELWEVEDFATGVIHKQCTVGIALLFASEKRI